MNQPQFKKIAEQICSKHQLQELRFVDKGSFKETYFVCDRKGNPLALKIVDSEKQSDIRTKREIQALERCKSDNICKFYLHDVIDLDKNSSYDYYVEEYLGGGTLTDRLQSGPLSLHETRQYGKGLTKAIQHLNTLELVHRDIKPDNIMFRVGDDSPVLVDLGIVRDLSLTSATHNWIQRGPGTPFFAAPEQLNNDKHLISWKTDQFSLGVVLSICILGHHPYQTEDIPFERVVEYVAERKPIPEQFYREVEESGLKQMVKMVQPWSIQRYQSPEELLKIFE